MEHEHKYDCKPTLKAVKFHLGYIATQLLITLGGKIHEQNLSENILWPFFK